MTAPVFVEYIILSRIVGDVFRKLNVIMKVYKLSYFSWEILKQVCRSNLPNWADNVMALNIRLL